MCFQTGAEYIYDNVYHKKCIFVGKLCFKVIFLERSSHTYVHRCKRVQVYINTNHLSL